MHKMIIYQGHQANVSVQYDGKRKLYRLEWPDYSLDWIYKTDDGWHAETILSEKQVAELGKIIDQWTSSQ